MPPRPGLPRRLAAALLPPLLAYALAQLLLSLAAARAGLDPLRAASWCQGDSGHYLTIAVSGYELFPCPEPERAAAGQWCGNAGWLPGYPLVLRSLRAGGARVRPAGAVLSVLCGASALVLLWTRFLASRVSSETLAALVLAAFFPGAVYQHAVFPISMFSALSLLSLDALARGRPASGAVAGAAAAFTYSTGFLLSPVAALYVATTPRASKSRRLWRAGFVAAVIGLGSAAVLLLQQWSVGAWDAFFRVQRTYGHGLHNPAATLFERLLAAFDLRASGQPKAPAAQTLLVLAWIAVLTVWLWRQRASLAEHERLVALFTLAFWAIPLVVGSGVALHRAEALLLPSAALAPRLSRWTAVLFAVAAVVLTWPMGLLFFQSALL